MNARDTAARPGAEHSPLADVRVRAAVGGLSLGVAAVFVVGAIKRILRD